MSATICAVISRERLATAERPSTSGRISAPLDTRLRAEALRGTRRRLPSGIPFRLTAIPSAPFRGFCSAYWRNVGQHICSCLESRYPQTFCGVHTYAVAALGLAGQWWSVAFICLTGLCIFLRARAFISFQNKGFSELIGGKSPLITTDQLLLLLKIGSFSLLRLSAPRVIGLLVRKQTRGHRCTSTACPLHWS